MVTSILETVGSLATWQLLGLAALVSAGLYLVSPDGIGSATARGARAGVDRIDTSNPRHQTGLIVLGGFVVGALAGLAGPTPTEIGGMLVSAVIGLFEATIGSAVDAASKGVDATVDAILGVLP